jgi:hypothetical protein
MIPRLIFDRIPRTKNDVGILLYRLQKGKEKSINPRILRRVSLPSKAQDDQGRSLLVRSGILAGAVLLDTDKLFNLNS